MSAVDSAALAAAIDVIADAVARKVVDQLTAGNLNGYVDQTASPLGRRRHIDAVRRLVATGESGAAQVGRRYLMSRERLDAELEAAGKRPSKPAAHDELAELRERYARAAA